jgi:hypothetical protein
MEKAIWLAYIFGPYMVILGLWCLFYHDNMMKICTSVKNNPGVFYILTCANLLVGLVIINMWNYWYADMSIFVTLLGWMMAIRGVLGFFVPQVVFKMWNCGDTCSKLVGLVPLVWGVLLCIFANMGM